jgi:arylsulfatase A-like enzyme
MAIDDYTRTAKKPTMYPKSTVERQRLAEALKWPDGVSHEEFFDRLCPPLPANYEVPALEPECITTAYLGARSFREFARDHWSDEQWQLHRWAYCRLTEMADDHISKVLDALREAGLEEETVIVFTSDHGDLDAAHRLEHKSILYEEAARVPFIVSYQGVTPPGHVDTTHLISVGLDLIPTLCDYAGIDPPKGLLGRSVRALAEGRTTDGWRDYVVAESRAGRMLRTARFKYNVYESGEHREQLIDLEKDPGEVANLAQDPDYQEVLNDHRRRLRQWVEETGDDIARPYIVSGP